jgi:hypothetical protein
MVRYIQSKDGPTEINVRSYTGDGSTITFVVTQNQSVNKVIVTENGVIQKPTDDYTISGTNLTFTTAPSSGVQIILREMPI